jgi:hypothetical protein
MLANPDKVNDLLTEMGIDVLISTSLKNVYYTSGIWTTPTVTPGAENHEKTGLYTDYSPPKSLSIWSAGESEPAVVIPPVVVLADVNLFAATGAALVGVGLYVHPEWYVIDAAGVLIGATAAGLFGITFGILPALLRHFRDARPDVQLLLREATSDVQIEALLAGDVVQVGHVPDLFRLLRQRLDEMRMRMAERGDGDATREVEITLARLRKEKGSLAPREGQSAAGIGRKKGRH